MKKKLLIFFTFLSISCFAQFSKTHYIPPLSGSEIIAAQDQYLYISTPSTTPVNVKINAIGVGISNISVSKNSPYVYNIGFGTSSQLHVNPYLLNTPLSDKGFIIEAENLIYVAARVIAGNSNQAGSLVSKGISAIGNEFRVGAFVNTGTFNSASYRYTFLSILATENNTVVDFSDIKTGVTLLGNPTVGNTPPSVTLNRGQSYVLATEDNSAANKDGLIGALVKSSKPIVMNCGSYGGTNGNINNNLDLGFDQIVPAKTVGNEYIFVRGFGLDILERPLLVAHEDNTYVYLNGSAIPYNATPLNAGQYIILDGTNYSANGSLYVRTSKNVFAYQSVGSSSQANQEMFFVPPLNCSTPNIVDNIPFIEQIGSTTFTTNSGLNIVTEKGATIEISINGIKTPIGVAPKDVIGNVKFETYTLSGLTGNIGVYSSKQVYVSYFGSNVNATYGGYYSGFDLKPEIISDKLTVTTTSCIPNIILKLNSLSSYDTFQWIFNDVDIIGATTNTYTPTKPGYYQVRGSISSCATSQLSDKIPVSICTPDLDNDGTNNNVDIDNDNDGIINCTESYGNQGIDISNIGNGNIIKSDYINSFIGTLTSNPPSAPSAFIGKTNGDFITEVPSGNGSSLTYMLNFTSPISLALEYIAAGNNSDLFNSNSEFILKSPTNRTITVLNPNNQLLIDTNYDGIFESDITEFSSFEIRFRLNSAIPLAAGTGTFSFRSYLTESISITHKNLSDAEANKASFTILATCIPKDTDLDGIPDQLDLDSDNDGIPDTIEAQGKNYKLLSFTDSNKNGLDNAFEPGFVPIDTDNDGIMDYLDIDSDNDGIYDLVESGSTAPDSNLDGIINEATSAFGLNGLSNSLETHADSGVLNYSIADTDGDKTYNAIDLDSDNDLCTDVIEAGFQDPNGDGYIGNSPVTVDNRGKVITTGAGYTTPNNNYINAAPIEIRTQPNALQICELESTTITVVDNGGNSYQWQVSTDGSSWNPVTPNAVYSGTTTSALNIANVTNAMNNYKYRVLLNKTGNSCGLLSSETTLKIYVLPTVTNPVTLVQCDDDGDGISNFNLREKNSFISANYALETFTYYTSSAGAEAKNPNVQITDPLVFTSPSASVWTRVENQNGCYRISQLNLIVSTTQIPATFERAFSSCDDYLDIINDDKDGISTFDFSSVTNEIKTTYLSSSALYDIKYYRNQSDALAEMNEITNTSNYRNIGYPNQQQIWVRVESTLDNACYGLGPHIKLTVNAKPNINTNEDHNDDTLICSNLPTFFVQLNAGIIDNSPITNYTYVWSKDNEVLVGNSDYTLDINKMGNYSVTVTSSSGCSRTRNINVIASDIAHIEIIHITDLAETNSITVNVSGQGNYEYSLDAIRGPFQSSNLFDNVSAGIHEVFVNDTNGCGTIQKTIAVIGVPKYFTPNGDGFNDYWNLKGVNSSLNAKSIIYIFDRYGKLIKEIIPNSKGWDGNFNGIPLPSDDYWYTIKLEDNRELKGHFSLKR